MARASSAVVVDSIGAFGCCGYAIEDAEKIEHTISAVTKAKRSPMNLQPNVILLSL